MFTLKWMIMSPPSKQKVVRDKLQTLPRGKANDLEHAPGADVVLEFRGTARVAFTLVRQTIGLGIRRTKSSVRCFYAEIREEASFLAEQAGIGIEARRISKPVREAERPVRPETIRRALKQFKELVSDDRREAQIVEVGGSEARAMIQQAEAYINKRIKLSVATVCVTTVGVFLFKPAVWVGSIAILYLTYGHFKGGVTDLWRKRKATVQVLDMIAIVGLIAAGYIWMASVSILLMQCSLKLTLRTEDRSRKMIGDLFGKQPRSVWILVDGQEVEIPFDLLAAGDLLVVHAGQMIPADGVIASGTAAVDQHVLTGEAQPAERAVGDLVFATTTLLSGQITVRVDKTGAETTAARIRDLLANTVDFREALQARWQDAAEKTVLPTLAVALGAWALLSSRSALAVLNSNYTVAMKVFSPLEMLNFLQRGAKNGILIKDGRSLETLGKVDTVVFDKTGTLTLTMPEVKKVHGFGAGLSHDEVLSHAAAAEYKQSHPIAQAILEEASRRNLPLWPIEDARYEIGYGIQANIGGRLTRVGSARYMRMQGISIPPEASADLADAQASGASVVYVAVGDQAAGAIELQPKLRPEAREVVAELKQMGLQLYIISGDNAAPTKALATDLGIDDYFSEVLPQDKSQLVEGLQTSGRHVCFIGDGINDAIALKSAAVSVSLRGASSLATNTAQIILMDESLKQLTHLFELADDYNANLRTLLTTTFVPSLASLAGIFFLGTGTPVAILLFNISMFAGLANAVWPALKDLEQSGQAQSTSETQT